MGYLRHCTRSMHQSGLHLYVFMLGGEEGRGREGDGRTRGNPYVTSSPTRVSARFVSLADFCRLTPKHPWTLPPPFTFNLYQSIQPSRRIERTSMHETGRTRRERHRALFTADSVFTPWIQLPLSPSFTLSPSSILFRVPFVASNPKQSILWQMEPNH